MLASGLSLLLPLWEPFKLLGSWPRRGGHSNPGNCLSFAAQIWRSCHVSKRQKQRLQNTEFRVRRPNLSKILPLILTSCLLLVNDLDFHKKYLFIYVYSTFTKIWWLLTKVTSDGQYQLGLNHAWAWPSFLRGRVSWGESWGRGPHRAHPPCHALLRCA